LNWATCYFSPVSKARTLLLLLLVSLTAFAGHENETTGGRAKGLGGASLTLADGWSGVNNQAALGLVKDWNFGVAYQNNFLLPELGLRALAVTAPVGGGTFALNGHSFGYSQYTENRLGLAYGRSLSKSLSIGVQMNYLDTRIGDVYGNRGTLVAEVGILLQPAEDILLAAHVYNPTRSSLADFDDERIPSILSIGGQYLFSERVSAMLEVEKDVDRPVNIQTGIEYSPVENFDLRLGFATAQQSFSFGLGYIWKNAVFALAAHWDQNLGYGTTASLGYRLAKKKKE